MDMGNKVNEKRTDHNSQTATQSAPRPGDFELGSVRSKAAARAMVERKGKGKPVFIIQFIERLDDPLPAKPYKLSGGEYARMEFYSNHPPEE